MIDFLSTFKSLVKVESVRSDNNIFKLHYKFTVIMLIVFAALLSSKQYFGEPIQCHSSDPDQKDDFLNTFCWIHGTFIINRTLSDPVLPGMGNALSGISFWQMYYQWVCVVFCLQALLFYFPRYLWKIWECGRLGLLINDLSGPLVNPTWNTLAKDKLVCYLMSGRSSHNIYALRYFFCEILNLINAIAQIFFMDWFLTGKFAFYGFNILSLEDSSGVMSSTFPKLAKCEYHKYGPSATIMSRDAICLLPLNVLNEKLFVLLWFWLIFLSFASCIALIYRIMFIFASKIRVYLLMSQTRSLSIKQAKMIIKEISFGDFFLLYNIGKNVNPIIYKELVLGIHDYMKGKKPLKAYEACIEEIHVI